SSLMRIFGRNDVFLIGGLAIAVWVVSSRQLGTLLDRAREIDHSRGLQLVPALFILAAVLIHQFRKREEMRVNASLGELVTTEHLRCSQGRRHAWAMVRTGDVWICADADGHQVSRRAARCVGGSSSLCQARNVREVVG
ncbi:MAG TPA: hypothetical protein VLN59_08160, partial [Burkholderiales bacterium]|nr:hypothetical protein [Burkholderiales bacterium]